MNDKSPDSFGPIAAVITAMAYELGLLRHIVAEPRLLDRPVFLVELTRATKDTKDAVAALNAIVGPEPTSKGPPAAPVDGDLWQTAQGWFARVNGVTHGPLPRDSHVRLAAELFPGLGTILQRVRAE